MNRAKWNKGDYWEPKTHEIDVKTEMGQLTEGPLDENGNLTYLSSVTIQITETLPEYHEKK